LRVLVIRPNPYRRDDLITELWEHGTVGIVEEVSRVKAYFPESRDLSGLVTDENGEIIEILVEDAASTYQATEENSEPVPLGNRFVVLNGPASGAQDASRIPLLLPMSTAFGSGRHESTQLMVEAMEVYLQRGTVVIDAGCGSGILSEVARHLGAGSIIACDTHSDAISTARQTCAEAAAFIGSVDAIETSVADIVLANISAKVVDLLAADLVRVAKPDGLVLLSGFIHDRTPERFRPDRVFELNGWLCWVCRPELIPTESSEESRAVQPFETQWW
jgi:ribosomal protein L11 methylase PrmA